MKYWVLFFFEENTRCMGRCTTFFLICWIIQRILTPTKYFLLLLRRLLKLYKVIVGIFLRFSNKKFVKLILKIIYYMSYWLLLFYFQGKSISWRFWKWTSHPLNGRLSLDIHCKKLAQSWKKCIDYFIRFHF